MTANDILRWRLHAASREYRSHVDRARDIVRQAVGTASFCLSWSGGKDSTAMVHLVRSVAPETPIMIQFDDCDWPEKRPYVERVCAALGLSVCSVEPDFSVWQRMRTGRIGEENFCDISHELTREAFLRPLADAQHELGCDGVFLGLRIEESRNRRIHLCLRGGLYQIASGDWHCCPLAHWTAEDVFAYLIAHGIEINPCYGQNRFLSPEEIRISWAVPTPTSLGRGAVEHLRHYYPVQFQRMRDLGVY